MRAGDVYVPAGVSIFVVRHAKAGSRDKWDGDDRERPLTRAGWRQVDGITARLKPEPITALYSSPYVRCVQSLEPLADALGLTVVADDRLAEESPVGEALELLVVAGDGAVLCTHGDVIEELIGELARRGTELRTPPDWRKATIWILDPPDGDGLVDTASVEPPPDSWSAQDH
jgi:8-oxo-dGTP diphosphatase